MRFHFWALVLSLGLVSCAAPDEIGGLSVAQAQEGGVVSSDPSSGEVTHIGNAGVMITIGESKILFDPLYTNGYNNYHLVPEDVKSAVIEGKPPFDDIDLVLISHAHGDHFDAADLIAFYENNPDVLFLAPTQALQAVLDTGSAKVDMLGRFFAISPDYTEEPQSISFENFEIDMVRIPHAGGPARREIQNIVYRVTLEDALTVMHMGDADPALEHYTPYEAHWQEKVTDTAFPPYWFFLSAEGIDIVDDVLNTGDSIGVHVPVKIPDELIASGRNFLGAPGGTRILRPGEK